MRPRCAGKPVCLAAVWPLSVSGQVAVIQPQYTGFAAEGWKVHCHTGAPSAPPALARHVPFSALLLTLPLVPRLPSATAASRR